MGTASALVDSKILRFLFFGAINTLVGLSLYLATFEVSGSVTIAAVAANLIGPLFNFFSTGRFVFRNKRLSALLQFLAGYAFVCILNILAVYVLLEVGIGPRIAQVLCLPMIVLISYMINDRLVFRSRNGESLSRSASHEDKRVGAL